jgi:hypothetical protein
MKLINKQWSSLVPMGLLSLLFSNCGFISDGEAECAPTFQVSFRDDKNLSFADAFDNEVNTVTLYAFDEEGTLVWENTESGDALHPAEGKYAMNISSLTPGRYRLVAWGDLEENTSFQAPALTPGVSTLTDLTCRLNRDSRAEGVDEVDTDLDPLFHGMTEVTIPEEADFGTHTYEVQLTKNTNYVTVVLQQLDGSEINADEYDFAVTADNGHLNYDNSLLHDENTLRYNAWSVRSAAIGSQPARRDTLHTRATQMDASSLVAHLTTSRFVLEDNAETRPTLIVSNKKTGDVVLSIPIIEYALMVRSYYPSITDDQDYLDRQHDYNMTFFLESGTWLNNVVLINSWRVVLINEGLH